MADERPTQERPVELNAAEARAGSTPGVTRYVLAASLILIIVIFAALLAF